MLRITFLLIGFCMIFSCYGQDLPAKLEKGLINYSYDSTFALIQKGKKSGLYNLQSSEFEIPFDKRGKLLAKLDGRFFLVDADEAAKYSALKGELKKTCDSISGTTGICWELSRTERGEIIINLFEVPASWNGDEYGRDLVPDYAKGIQSAGVFDPNNMQWVLSKEFMAVYPYNDMLFAITLDSEYVDKENYLRYVFTYHIYERVNDKYEILTEVSKFDNSKLAEIMKLDSIQKTEMDDHLFYSFKEGKMGILYSDLNHSGLHQDYHLQLQQIIRPTHNFIYQISDRSFISYQSQPEKTFNYFEIGIEGSYEYTSQKKKENFPAISAFHEKHNPSKIAEMLGDSIDIVNHLTMSSGQFGVQKGLEYINDSLIKIVNNNDGYYEAVQSINWPGEDSIDWNGEVVYTLEDQSYNTGVYNINEHKWELQPIYKNAHFAGEHWLVQQVKEQQEENIRRPAEEVLILDLGLSKLASVDVEDFLYTGVHFTYLFPKGVYTKYDLFGSEDLHEEFNGLHPICTGVRSNGKMDLFAPRDYNFTPYMIKENVDFAFADPECYALFWLNDDTLTFSFFDTTYQVNGAECELVFEYDSRNGIGQYSVLQISNSDTVITKGSRKDRSQGEEYSNHISLQLRDDQLIVNSCPIISTEVLDPEYYEPMGWMTREFGHSAIWQRSAEGFLRQTPYFAHIKPLPKGFIVSTPSYSSVPGWERAYEQYPDQWDNKEKRFLWLNDSLKAKNFVDYYDFRLIEDLSFGLSLCTANGCMFITYGGKVITTNEWEEFEIVEGRLKAFHSGLIRDENGDPKLDETGEYMYAKEPITEYFDLPK